MILIYKILLFIFITIISASYFGKYSSILEILSNFKLQYFLLTVIFFIFALLFKQNKSFILLSVLLLLQLFTIYQSYSKPSFKQSKSDISEEVTLLQYNTHFLNSNYTKIVDYLVLNHTKLDVIFLQEVTPELKKELIRLEKYYAYNVTKDEKWFGRAFYSKIPILKHEIKIFSSDSKSHIKSSYNSKDSYFGNNTHYLIVHLETNKHCIPITFYGIHTANPLIENAKYRNNELEIIASEILNDTSRHKILAGDFNTTPFSYWFKWLEDTSGLVSAERGNKINNTWPSWIKFNLLRISIDHALVSKNIIVADRKIGDDLGSDHLPVILKFRIIK